jgi:hypothetical protein
MKKIEDFLSKFKIIRDPRKNREIVVGCIFKKTQIKISENELEINKNIINLNCHPAFKNKVFLNKEAVLEDIKKALPDLYIIDIR